MNKEYTPQGSLHAARCLAQSLDDEQRKYFSELVTPTVGTGISTNDSGRMILRIALMDLRGLTEEEVNNRFEAFNAVGGIRFSPDRVLFELKNDAAKLVK